MSRPETRCAVEGCGAQDSATIDLGAGVTLRVCIEHTDHLVTVSRRSASAYLAEREQERERQEWWRS